MSSMSQLDWAECFLEPHPDPQLARDFRRDFGTVPPGIEYITACPWLARSSLTVNMNQNLVHHTSFDFSELVWLAVSQDNSCRFCYAANRTLLRILGHSEDRIRAVEEALFTAELEPRERAALDFARRVSRAAPPLGPGDKASLMQAGYSSEAADELAFMAAFMVFGNRFSTLAALPVEEAEALPDRLVIRLLRPLLERFFRSKYRPGTPRALTDAECEGPYGSLLRRLSPLPVATGLRALLEDAWQSTALPNRTRLLVFAVIARGIGCPRSEREVERLLAHEGLGREWLEPILAHLGGPDLDPVEAAVVPFARETIRYQAIDIQRKARVLHDEIGTERFLEVAGLASLANMICRLGVVGEPA
jgi:AhpD family alkylhydroperoxidase